MMFMVSIDSSTKKTGMALFIGGRMSTYTLIDLSKIKDVNERIDKMCLDIIKQLSKWSPSVVYIEEPKGEGRNVELVRKLSEILGAVRAWCLTHGSDYVEVKPSVWRKYVGIEQGNKKRDELKQASIDYVYRKHGVVVNDDVADSICIGSAMINKYGGKG